MAHCGRSDDDSLSPSRHAPPRARAEPRKRQCILPAHVGLSGGNNPDLDPPHSPRAAGYDRDVPDHAGGYGRHVNRIHPGGGWRYYRSGPSPYCLENFTRYRVAASLFLSCISVRRIVSQARVNNRRAWLRNWSPGGARDDSSGYSPAEPGGADRIRSLDLVVRHAWTLG